MRSRVAALGCAVGLSLGLASCGGDEVSVDEYADSACGAINEFVTVAFESGVTAQAAGFNTDLEQAKEDLAASYGEIAAAAGDAAAELEDAGTPDIENGDKLAADIQTGFTSTEAAMQDAQAAAEALPTDSQEAYESGVEEIKADVDATLAETDETLSSLDEYPEAKEALESSPGCAGSDDSTTDESAGTTTFGTTTDETESP